VATATVRNDTRLPMAGGNAPPIGGIPNLRPPGYELYAHCRVRGGMVERAPPLKYNGACERPETARWGGA
jgi:hypothetical protein